MREVAALAGVSVATVSHVINDTRRISPDTRERVEQAIARLGFEPDPVGRMLSKRRGGAHGGGPRAGTEVAPRAAEPPEPNDGGAAETARDGGPLPTGATSGVSDSASTAKAARLLLRLVRAAQPISRAELARRLGVNRSTVTDVFKPLVASGVVREGPLPQAVGAGHGLGRPALGKKARRFAAGLYQYRDTYLYVNKGVGFGFRFRFGVRPEVALLTLRPA
jgi:transcriptional regulator with XRE-family HTH domain